MLINFLFYLFSAVLIFSAVRVVSTRQPVHAALCLVLAFFSATVLWLLLQAEFLALALIFVYVGAVMTLFLFVVMMLNVRAAPRSKKSLGYWLPGMILMVLLLLCMGRFIQSDYFKSPDKYHFMMQSADYSNTQQLGALLYTQYAYPFEVAGVLLLVAIVAVIALAFRGTQKRKVQSIAEQLSVRKADRLRMMKNV